MSKTNVNYIQMLQECLAKHRISEIYSSILDARNIEARNSGELTFPGRFLGPTDRISRLARRKLRNRVLLAREIAWYYCRTGVVIYRGDYARKCHFATVVPELIISSLECRFRYKDFNLITIVIAVFKYRIFL